MIGAGVPELGQRGRAQDPLRGESPDGVGLRGFESHPPHHPLKAGKRANTKARKIGFLTNLLHNVAWILRGAGAGIRTPVPRRGQWVSR